MITARRPRRVVVAPSRAAFVAVNKYRCDFGAVRSTRRLRLRFPGKSTVLSLSVPRDDSIDYCGRGDPGSTIATSPFVATRAGVWRR